MLRRIRKAVAGDARGTEPWDVAEADPCVLRNGYLRVCEPQRHVMHRIQHRRRVDATHDLQSLMKGRPTIGERRADTACEARRNNLVFVIHAEERAVDANTARELRARADFVIPAQL